MNKISKLDLIPSNLEMLAGIDICGNFKDLFKSPVQVQGALFLLCTRGNCKVSIDMNHYSLKKYSMCIIMPDIFFQIIDQSNDCRFEYITYSKGLLQGTKLFSHTIEFTHYILSDPLIELNDDLAEYIKLFLRLQMKAQKMNHELTSSSLLSLSFTQLLMVLGNIYKQKPISITPQYNRNQEIVKELVRIIVLNYNKERNVSFYANALHLSPQHLSTTIKKATGKTLTDILSSFIIHDAQAKLKSTGMTIQEIAYSLNFPDISFFGKYFKRYTGMSPKQYRNSKENS